MSKIAIILARVSTAGQAEEELPIESQLDVSRRKAEELGAKVVKEFVEEGVSGRKLKRDVFQEAVDYCLVHEVDYFIMWNTARFSRHRALAAWTKFNLRRSGTELVYVSQSINASTDEGWLLEGLFELFDENYSRTVSKDTTRSMLKNAREGFFNGGRVPFGYRVVNVGKRRRLQIDESEAPIVRQVFRDFRGGAGTRNIAKALNLEGSLRRGQRWSKNQVSYTLKNWVYAGYVTFNRTHSATRSARPETEWIRVPSHEPIVPMEVFMEIQAMLADATPNIQLGSPKSRMLFTGMLKCGRCRYTMQVEKATGRSKVYSYYNCGAAVRGTGCRSRRIRADVLDEWLLECVMDRIITPTNVSECIRQIDDLNGRWVKERQLKRTALVSELRSAEQRRKNLYDVLELNGRNAPDLGDLKPRLMELNELIRNAERDLTALEAEPPPELQVTQAQIDEMTEFMRDVISSCPDPAKIRDFLASIIDQVEILDDEVVIQYRPEKLVSAGGSRFIVKTGWLPDQGKSGHQWQLKVSLG